VRAIGPRRGHYHYGAWRVLCAVPAVLASGCLVTILCSGLGRWTVPAVAGWLLAGPLLLVGPVERAAVRACFRFRAPIGAECGWLDWLRAETEQLQRGATLLADRAFGTLSEGERKRVQIARALMTDPELMLLDEPAAGLALGGREDLLARLSELAADPDSPALVLVTHHVEEIPPGFTHALLLREGREVTSGLLDHVLTEDNLSATFGLALQVQASAGAGSPGPRHGAARVPAEPVRPQPGAVSPAGRRRARPCPHGVPAGRRPPQRRGTAPR